MYKTILCRVFSIVLVFSGMAFAHEGKPHIKGTVSVVDAQHMEVSTTDGKTVSVLLTQATEYIKGKTLGTRDDLKIGLRVVIHVTGEGASLTAVKVQLPIEK